jgi:hypothetical protein
VGELELRSVIEIFEEFEWALAPLSADDEAERVEVGERGVGFMNILARVSKEGVVPVETSAVRWFSSSCLIGVEAGMETGGERVGVVPEQWTEVRGTA